MPADASNYPQMVPAGDYRMDTRVYNGKNEVYFSIKSFAVVKAKGLHVLKMK